MSIHNVVKPHKRLSRIKIHFLQFGNQTFSNISFLFNRIHDNVIHISNNVYELNFQNIYLHVFNIKISLI